jgi:hypothetical protein
MKKLLSLLLFVSFSTFAQNLKIEEISGSVPGESAQALSVIDVEIRFQTITENVVAMNGYVRNIKILSRDSILKPFESVVFSATKKGSKYKGHAIINDAGYEATCLNDSYRIDTVHCYINYFPKNSGARLYFELLK